LTGHEIPHQFIKEQEVEQAHDCVAVEREHRVTGVLENRTILQQQTQEEGEVYGEDDLLDHERNNAANAHILNPDTTIIFLKKRVGNSHDVLKPAKD
jgi:cytochrome c1